MAGLRYENVHLALGEANPHVRHALKTALYARGARDISDCTAIDSVVELLDDVSVDLLICDVNLPGGDFCEVVHRLRDHSVGRNPFLVTIATTTEAPSDGVRRILGSGVDDLLLKPLSVDRVVERINKLIHGRKPFVVTHDYTGPDRRGGVRPEEKNPIEPIAVPNTLKSKIEGVTDLDELQRVIDGAVGHLNDRKMERYSVEIAFLARRIAAANDGGGASEPMRRDLERLLFVGNDLSRRLRGTAYAHAADLAGSLVIVTERAILARNEPAQRDIALLLNLAQAIQRAFSADFRTVEAAQKISDTIARFHGAR